MAVMVHAKQGVVEAYACRTIRLGRKYHVYVDMYDVAGRRVFLSIDIF